jgi:2-methylcitrate dehydratase PrpD
MAHDDATSVRLAEFALGLRDGGLPGAVRAAAKAHLLDTIGVAIGARPLASSRQVAEVATRWGGAAEATVWSGGDRLPAPAAAFVNGTLAHSLDFDDTHLASITHPSACVVPAALAAAELAGADGRQLLAAIVAGYEITARVGLAAAGAFHARGFHATPLCGAFGAAAAAGSLAGLSVEELVSAFGIVASQAAGIQAFVDEGAWTKRLHAGWAAHSALVAVQLARAGFAGPRRALENRYGFFASHAGQGAFDRDRVADGLGARWETEAIALKPYPCCHFNHACMDAALGLMTEHRFAVDDVAGVEVSVPAPVIPVVCQPREVKAAPPTPYGALFSLPFCVAFVLVRGALGVDDMDEHTIRDPRILALAARVDCRALATSPFPATYPGAVRVRLRDGRILEREEPINRGHADHPLSAPEVLAKFRKVAAHGAPGERIEAIAHAIDLIELGPVTALADALTGAVEPTSRVDS